MPETVRLYTPREQFEGFHKREQRFSCIVAHRRAGKTVACIADLVDAALRCKRKSPRFAYIAPLYKQAKDVAWEYLKGYARQIPGATINESELRVDLPNDGRVRLYGADNPDALRGIYLDGVILDEYADMRPQMWSEVIRPALADRKGWAVFIGTPKGRNAFFEIYEYAQNAPDWFALMLRASETGLLDEGELRAAAQAMTREQYAQEFECSFEAAIIGAYWGREIAEAERAGRIIDVPYAPEVPVHTAWDLGIGDSTAIWMFQVVGHEVRIIDFYQNHGHSLEHYANALADRPYKYGDDWVPHDAKVRELGSGRTRVETLKLLNRKPRVVMDHKVDDGINAARLTLGNCWFDRIRCREGLEALRQYRADYDEKRLAFKTGPLHDWTSHPADAFRYLAMAWREMAPGTRSPEQPRGPQTLDEMLDQHDRELRTLEKII